MNWRARIRDAFTSRYTRSLEDEVKRLRAENRALVNSVLGIAGLPPLKLDAEIARDNRKDISGAAKGHFRPVERTAEVPQDTANQSTVPIPQPGIVLPANPHRRRSWQQINRILEIEESRRISNRDNSESMQATPRG
jgi:hypothetical protein